MLCCNILRCYMLFIILFILAVPTIANGTNVRVLATPVLQISKVR